jgi:glycosyltransferase involved in cell wall biosynthesis
MPVVRVMNCPTTSEIWHSVGPRLMGGKLKIYYHGSIGPERVPLRLLDALALVPDEVSLSVAGYETTGHPDYVGYFKQEARLRGLESRVRFLGPVRTRGELFKLCSEHNVGLALLPKQTADPNLRAMAGASNKVFDYLACGLPVLVSDLHDDRRLFVDAGVARCCDPEDPKSIASELQWFLDHPLQANEMGERGRLRIISEWNYEKQFQPVLDVVLRELERIN